MTEFESEEISNVGEVRILRVALKSESDAIKWVSTFGETTRTEWVKLRTYPEPVRYVYRCQWGCAFSSKNKRAPTKRNLACPAQLDLLIKLNTEGTRKTDRYLRGDNPKAAIITITGSHNHDIDCAETSKMMRGKSDLRDTFYQYFQRGMSPAQATKLHEQKLMVEERGTELLADAHFNPTKRTVYHWHCLWRKLNRTVSGQPAVETLGSFWENFMSKEMQNTATLGTHPADVADAGAGPAPCSPAPSHPPPKREEDTDGSSGTVETTVGKHVQSVIDDVASGKCLGPKDAAECRGMADALFTDIVEKCKRLHEAQKGSSAYVRHLETIKDKLSSIKHNKDYMNMLARITSPRKTKTSPRKAQRLRRTNKARSVKEQPKRRRIKPLPSESEDE